MLQKLNSLKIIMYLAAFMVLGGCSQEDVSAPYRVKILTPTADSYEYKEVLIESLTNLTPLEGDYVEIRGGAELDVSKDIDEIVKSSSPEKIYKTRGKKPNINYLVKNNVVTPKDFTSLALLTIYHNYEQVFKFWEREFGFTVANFGKLTIFNNPRLTLSDGELSATVEAKVNAAFVPGSRDFWMFRESKVTKIPLKLNTGVMAHEFFHAVFDSTFADRDVDTYSAESYSASYILSAINEGLSDFYSFVVTGRVTDFSNSLETLGKQREVPVSWTLSDVSTSLCSGGFYCEGSILASALYSVSELLKDSYTDPLLEVAKITYQALGSQQLKDDWKNNKDLGNFLFSHLLIAIKDLAPAADQPIYCSEFKKWFDIEDELTHLESNGC